MVVSFDPGCAADLYAKGLHPRLLLNPEDIEKLRAACREGWCKRVLEGLRSKIAPLVTRVHECDDLPALMGRAPGKRADPKGGEIAACLADIALVGLLDEDRGALTAAHRVLAEAPTHGDNSYGDVLAYDLMQPMLMPAERAAYIGWAVADMERCIALAGPAFMQSAGNNTEMTHMLDGLARCLLISNDLGAPDLTAKRESLIRCFEAALYSAIGPEGYPAEDIGYGTIMTGRLLRMASMLRRSGYFDAYTRCPRLARFGRAMLHFVQPWGMFLSNTGDHGDDFGGRDLALAHLARFNHDPTLIWLLATLCYPCLDPQYRSKTALWRETELGPGQQSPTTAFALIALADAPKAVHPRDAQVPTAFKDSDRGIVSFRSGWRDNDTYAYFDGSQRPTSAQGHAHDTAGHFTLSAEGEYFAVSPGRYGIEQDQHNTLLVGGKSGQTTDGQWRASWHQGRLTDYRPDPLCDYASADASQQANCYWSYRHFGLVKCGDLPGYAWTVDDVNGANDYRSFWWTMYTAPGNTISITGNAAQVTGMKTGAVLDVRFAIPPAECYPKPHVLEVVQDMPGTSSHKYVSKDMIEAKSQNYVHHATFKRPRLVAIVDGYNGRVMAVMIPRGKGEAAPVVESIPTVRGALAMRVIRGGFEDTLIFAFGHSLLEANGVRGRGRWLMTRRDQDRRLVAHTIHQGDWLEVDGKPVKL